MEGALDRRRGERESERRSASRNLHFLTEFAAEVVLAVQVQPSRAEEAGGRQRASEVGSRALRAVENAAAGQRRSGATLLILYDIGNES